jgi:hypothetical protein
MRVGLIRARVPCIPRTNACRDSTSRVLKYLCGGQAAAAPPPPKALGASPSGSMRQTAAVGVIKQEGDLCQSRMPSHSDGTFKPTARPQKKPGRGSGVAQRAFLLGHDGVHATCGSDVVQPYHMLMAYLIVFHEKGGQFVSLLKYNLCEEESFRDPAKSLAQPPRIYLFSFLSRSRTRKLM